MKRALSSFWFANAVLLTFALSACSSTKNDDADELPLQSARQARNLAFVTTPPVARVDANTAEENYRAKVNVSDETWFDFYGRLGFFPRTLDVKQALTHAFGDTLAFYDPHAKNITLIGHPKPEIVVHELVHALQDQHFDTLALQKRADTVDSSLALAALVEGDAMMAQYRLQVWLVNRDPPTVMSSWLSTHAPDTEADAILDHTTDPIFFSARESFAYAYGTRLVARALGVRNTQPTWDTHGADALFAAPPATTKSVLDDGTEPDEALVPVGLGQLPDELGAKLEVRHIDRLGAWYTYLLFRPVATSPFHALAVAKRCVGEQLVILSERTSGDGGDAHPRTGLVWSTEWQDGAAAMAAAELLGRVHGTASDLATGTHAGVESDGEPLWLQQTGSRVVFIKNVAPDAMQALARAALASHAEGETLRPAAAFRVQAPLTLSLP